MGNKELKTLKDIEIYTYALSKSLTCKSYRNRIRQEAIKWIKEDKCRIRLNPNEDTRYFLNKMLEEWMKRLNITEEELKKEKNNGK